MGHGGEALRVPGYFFFSTQRSFSHATLAIVIPLTSHFDSPQTESHGTSGGFDAGTALQEQQSAKMVQSSVFLHSGPLGAGSGSAFVATAGVGSSALVLGSAVAVEVSSVRVAAESEGAFCEPPHAIKKPVSANPM